MFFNACFFYLKIKCILLQTCFGSFCSAIMPLQFTIDFIWELNVSGFLKSFFAKFIFLFLHIGIWSHINLSHKTTFYGHLIPVLEPPTKSILYEDLKFVAIRLYCINQFFICI